MKKAIYFTEESLKAYKQDLQKSFQEDEIDNESLQKGLSELDDLAIGLLKNGTVLYTKIVDDVEKGIGGEGSRGGKVISHTKSGKPIYEKGTQLETKHDSKHLYNKFKGSGALDDIS